MCSVRQYPLKRKNSNNMVAIWYWFVIHKLKAAAAAAVWLCDDRPRCVYWMSIVSHKRTTSLLGLYFSLLTVHSAGFATLLSKSRQLTSTVHGRSLIKLCEPFHLGELGTSMQCLSINQSVFFLWLKWHSHYEVHSSVVQRCQMTISGNDCWKNYRHVFSHCRNVKRDGEDGR